MTLKECYDKYFEEIFKFCFAFLSDEDETLGATVYCYTQLSKTHIREEKEMLMFLKITARNHVLNMLKAKNVKETTNS